MKAIAIVILFARLSVIFGDKARFDNYRVYSIEIENEKQLELLQQIENNQDSLLFLTPPTTNQTMVEILVPPHKFSDLSELCEKFEMKNTIEIENLQRLKTIKIHSNVICSIV